MSLYEGWAVEIFATGWFLWQRDNQLCCVVKSDVEE